MSSIQICPTPESTLDYVKKNETAKIRGLVGKNKSLLSFIYTAYDKNILNIACIEKSINTETVKTLLELKANPRDHVLTNGWEAIHWAAWKANYEILQTLLNFSHAVNPVDVNAKEIHGLNALHILVKYGKKKSDDWIKCAKLLIEKGIDVNCTDNANQTPIDIAKEEGVEEEIKKIIESRGENKYQTIDNLDIKREGDILMRYLKMSKEIEFEENLEHAENRKELKDYSDGCCTLLQKCCENNLIKAAEYLLKIGADYKHDKTTFQKLECKDYRKPIEIVADYGYSKIFKLLLDKYKIRDIPKGILTRILKYIDREDDENKQCYNLFVAKLKEKNNDSIDVWLKVNETYDGDINMNTPLLYAIRYGNENIVLELLDLGALLGAKNKNGDMPVNEIEPEVLEEHLNQCVNCDNTKRSSNEFEVKFNYRSLIPSYVDQKQNNKKQKKLVDYTEIPMINRGVDQEENDKKKQKKLVAETEVIFSMSKRDECKHLLKHPVIVSFLYLKWLRMQWLFWANLGFYIIFSLSLSIYIFAEYAFTSTKEKSIAYKICGQLSYTVLIITLIILISRELFQLWVAPKNYFRNLENYMEIVLIFFTSAIVSVSIPSNETRKQLSALSILLIAFELVSMLGNHPCFSTNVVMLKTVSFNFFKFFLWYSLLIIGFALSFYLLFTTNSTELVSDKKLENKSDISNDKEDILFENPLTSVFKTLIMLTGEFDANSINFNIFPVTGRLLFALFIFMIAIILLNLLNGLAVSDTQKIIDDSELVGHIARTQYLRYIETMLVGNILPEHILQKLNDICCCLSIGKEYKSIKKNLAEDATIFLNERDCQLTFFPNKDGLIQSSSRNSCVSCAKIYLDSGTLRRCTKIIQARRYQKSPNENNNNKKLEKDLEELKKSLNIIISSNYSETRGDNNSQRAF